jgi:hypothetical protein
MRREQQVREGGVCPDRRGRALSPRLHLTDRPTRNPVTPGPVRTPTPIRDDYVLEVFKRLFQAIYGMGLFEFLLKIGWKGALAVVIIIGIVVGVVLFGIAFLIALIL